MRQKTVLACILALMGIVAAAQPRSIGVRSGSTLMLSYEHSTVPQAQFFEANLGLDYMGGQPGIKVEATYNFILSKPMWTERGDWAVYLGPGLSSGYVCDVIRDSNMTEHGYGRHKNMGFMMAVAAQLGIEYTFWFPLQLSIDLRPMAGFHINDGSTLLCQVHSDETVVLKSKFSFYNYGLMGFIPSLSVRYSF